MTDATDKPDHAATAVFHLLEAADCEGGSASEHYHLSAASTRATLASVEASHRQSDVLSEAAKVNARLLDLMVQGEPTVAAAITETAAADHA